MKLDRKTAYKVSTYRGLVSKINQIHDNQIKEELIFIDHVYLRIFFSVVNSPEETKIAGAFISSDFEEADLCISIYNDYFKINNVAAQAFLLAHEVGHFKNRSIPVWSSKKRISSLKDGKVSDAEIAADRYAAKQILSTSIVRVMGVIADYVEKSMGFPEAAKELRLRASHI